MNIYLAYKFRYLQDKEALKVELQSLSDFFDNNGHKTFILGRDVQKWENHKYSKISTTLDIIKNIGKHKVLFVYSNSDVHSNGVPVEMILAKVFGLKTIFAKRQDLKTSFLEKMANYVIVFNDLDDLKHKSLDMLARVA